MNKITYCKTDYLETKPGAAQDAYCGICGDKMNAKRDVKAIRGWAAAMAGHNRDHDEFRCLNKEKTWHRQARALKLEIVRTASAKLTRIIKEELNEILATRKATKSKFGQGLQL